MKCGGQDHPETDNECRSIDLEDSRHRSAGMPHSPKRPVADESGQVAIGGQSYMATSGQNPMSADTLQAKSLFTCRSSTGRTLAPMDTESDESADVIIIYVQAGRTAQLQPSPKPQASLAQSTTRSLSNNTARCPHHHSPDYIVEVTDIFEDEGYTVIGPLPHDQS